MKKYRYACLTLCLCRCTENSEEIFRHRSLESSNDKNRGNKIFTNQMKLVFYSLILNNHQANVADELWNLTGHSYCFVELANLQAEHRKGDSHDYSDRPYLLRAWQSEEAYSQAMELAYTAECCVFSGIQALTFQKERMRLGLL